MKYLLLSLVISFQSFAATMNDANKGRVTLQSTGTPIEYKILIDSINSYQLSNKEKIEYLNKIRLTDAYFSLIPKSELFLLCKTETYKIVLDFPEKENSSKRTVNQELINILKEKSKSAEYNSFSRWILNAIITDLRQIISFKYYQTYLIQKSQKKKLSTLELVKIDKKIKILNPWVNLFLQNDPDQINLINKPLHFKVVDRLAYLTKIIFKTSSFEEDPTLAKLNELKFFKYSRELTKDESDLKKIDDIIGNISLFPKASDEYETPKSLPQAKNDWVPKDDLDKLRKPQIDLFPEPDPNYIRPDVLPAPVNDWILDN